MCQLAATRNIRLAFVARMCELLSFDIFDFPQCNTRDVNYRMYRHVAFYFATSVRCYRNIRFLLRCRSIRGTVVNQLREDLLCFSCVA